MQTKCFMCGDDMHFDIEMKGTETPICVDCEKLSGCCGAEIFNSRCSFCKENC
jgi:hypothetical protein